jgi:aspartyl-tRNA(Asn)/glutamyl-tRNA(Gln) amidotransferase subunit A
MMNGIANGRSAIELTKAIANKEISPVELMKETLDQAEALESKLNCFATYTPEIAMRQAKLAEQAVMDGAPLGLLHGLPVSVKDLISVKDIRFSSGSRALANNIGLYDAPSVERLFKSGGCLIGKTTTSEFGCKAVGDSPLTGITCNPWNLSKTPGGSSAGAAASIAAGITTIALGTDGGGSIRIPASLTGIFGIKAQFGRVPIFPVAATPTLAHVGPLARTVRDAALLLKAISGFDRRDPFSLSESVPDFLAACDKPIKGMRIAWSKTLGYASVDKEVAEILEKAVKIFEDLGCDVIEIDSIFESDPIELWMSEFYAGVGVRLKNTLRDQRELLDPAVANVLDNALSQTSEEYYSNVFKRYELREKVRVFFEGFDLLLTPATPCAAFNTGLNTPPNLIDRNIVSWVYYTYPFNLTGQPSATIPAGFTQAGLPVGLQLVSKINSETDIFRAASAFEAVQPWIDCYPKHI